jgi:hypothetical protein
MVAEGLLSSSNACLPQPSLSEMQQESGTRVKLGLNGILISSSSPEPKKNDGFLFTHTILFTRKLEAPLRVNILLYSCSC